MARGGSGETISTNLITAGTSIVGNITSEQDIRFEGTLQGDIVTKGKLVIGSTGEVRGQIQCSNADIEGFVEGRLTVAELLSLKASAKVLGDISTSKLAVEAGAIFTGTCSMKNAADARANQNKPVAPQPKL